MDVSLTYCPVAFLATGIVCWLTTLVWRLRFRWKYLPPGTMGWPVVGETLHFLAKGSAFYLERFSKYGTIYKTHLLGRPTVRVSGADKLRTLISREPKSLTMFWPRAVRLLFGEHSLAVVTGAETAPLKKTLLKTMTPNRLSDYLPCVQQHIRSHITSWKDRGRMLGFPACEDVVTDIMLELVLGCRKENDPSRKVRDALVDVNNNLFSLPFCIPGGGFAKAMAAREAIRDFVRQRLAAGKGDKDHVCMLDVFLATHGHVADGVSGDTSRLTDEQLMDNTMSFLINGSSTTSSAMCSALLLLHNHPEVVDRMREELEEKGMMDVNDDVPYDQLQQLTYIHNVEKEVLRLYPPAGGCFRKVEENMELNGYQIPKDWTVIYSIRDTHENTEAFHDRAAFLPERWDDPELAKRLLGEHQYSYIPFGAGPRSCVGKQLARMMIQVFLVELVKSVSWKLDNPEPKVVFLPATKPNDDLPVTFLQRQ